MKFLISFNSDCFNLVGDNSLDAFIPELWANESIAILEENMVMARLIHRDFQEQVAKFGDVVNTRKPGEFEGKRKTNADSVTVQDANATNVQVPLDQHLHTSFLIKDGEESKSFKELVEEYMAPAMLAQARFVDRVLLGQYVHFLKHAAGGLGLLTSTNAKSYILATRKRMNVNKAFMENRNLILNPDSEEVLLNLDIFTAANQVGDEGTALREASLGRKLGFNMFMCQNMASVVTAPTNTAGAINNAAGYGVGIKVLTVDGITGAIGTNTYLKIAGDDTVHRVSAHSETLGNTTSITLLEGLRKAVVDNAVITFYTPGQVNLGAGYVAGYAKEIVVDTITGLWEVGQAVSFGTTSGAAQYTIIATTATGGNTTGITLDRPLEAAIADNDKINVGPNGQYNLAFHRNSLALVVRPLALPMQGTGARSAVVNAGGLSMRSTITYDGNKQGHLVTLDMLFGVKVLNSELGAVMLG